MKCNRYKGAWEPDYKSTGPHFKRSTNSPLTLICFMMILECGNINTVSCSQHSGTDGTSTVYQIIDKHTRLLYDFKFFLVCRGIKSKQAVVKIWIETKRATYVHAYVKRKASELSEFNLSKKIWVHLHMVMKKVSLVSFHYCVCFISRADVQ